MDRRAAIPKLIETNIRLMKFCLFEEKATPERIWLSLDDDMLVTGLSLSLQCKVYQIQKKTLSPKFVKIQKFLQPKITWPWDGFIHPALINYYPTDFCHWISLMQWTFKKQVIFRFSSRNSYSGIRSIRHALSSWPSGATSFLLNKALLSACLHCSLIFYLWRCKSIIDTMNVIKTSLLCPKYTPTRRWPSKLLRVLYFGPVPFD